MFAKPYRHKSNNTLKNSEKKHLVQRVQNEFALASEDKAKELVPVKSSCICMKVILYSGDQVNVYSVDGVPILIETAEGLLPTVCALWKVPDLVPMLNIHTPVLPKIQGGAPLYLPGVNLPAGGAGFPIFQIGKVLAVRTEDNAAACVVGRAAMSSADMLLRASGICLDTLHFYGDQLCKDNKFNKIDRPKLGPTKAPTDFTNVNLSADIQQLTLQPLQEQWPTLGKQQWPSLGKPAEPAPRPSLGKPAEPAPRPSLGKPAEPAPQPPPPSPPPASEPRLTPEHIAEQSNDLQNGDTDDSDMTDVEASIPTDMDALLRWCLLSFLKLEGKSIELPLKTNLLYKNHLHPLCPPDRTVDVKKSSYKKLSKFLEAMQEEGLIEVREIERGVDAVVALSAAHAALRAHRVPPGARAQLAAARAPPPRHAAEYAPPRVRDMLCVTAHVHDLFAPLKKGTPLSAADVRAAVNDYVRMRNLSSSQVKGAVTLDATLANIVGKPAQEAVKWDVLMSSVHGKMTPSTEMQFPDGSVRLSKSRLEPVRMHVATRSGNKKVTLVSNLEQFGFNLASLAHACQLAVAATCGVTRSPAARADQLMLQGDQTHFVAKLLIEKYGLPKKFVEGADKALNKKNK